MTTKGQLVVVATPLGNLGDISRRALELLASADVVYCEDTRRSSTLFSAHDIPVHGRLRALHEHNEASLCEQIVGEVVDGKVVVLVSDAGTPGISDPGSRVVPPSRRRDSSSPPHLVRPRSSRLCRSVDCPRNASSWRVSSLARRGSAKRFSMRGVTSQRTVVFYESPQRLATTLHEMTELFGDRRCCVAREITKLHEEVVRGTVSELSEAFATRDVMGEIVVVLEGTRDTTVISDRRPARRAS
jgi:16S rRNA (cytidine1402-2'-O)-methyltransferase